MNGDKVEGVAQEIGGKLKDAAGGLTGDAGMQADGKVDQAAGTVKQMLGDAKATVGDVADRVAATASDFGQSAYQQTASAAKYMNDRARERPLGMVIAAGLVGAVVGYLLARPPHERVVQVGRARFAYRDR